MVSDHSAIVPPGIPPNSSSLEPLPYHRGGVEYLKTQETELWRWFASTQAQADYAESLRGELLKTTYRLDASISPGRTIFEMSSAISFSLKHSVRL